MLKRFPVVYDNRKMRARKPGRRFDLDRPIFPRRYFRKQTTTSTLRTRFGAFRLGHPIFLSMVFVSSRLIAIGLARRRDTALIFFSMSR